MQPAIQTALTEIEAIHTAMGRWMSGEEEQSEAVFQRFRDALAPGFVAVSPDGQARPRAAVLERLWESHNSADGANLKVTVDEASATPLAGPLVLAMYREWQHRFGQRRGRIVTALLQVDHQGAASWLHRHATFLPR